MGRVALLFLLFSSMLFGANECVNCHKGIEDIRDNNSSMMKAIFKIAAKSGHEGNDCIVCHGGNPKSKKKKKAHLGTVEYFKTNKGPKEFYPSPASSRINQNTCGICHEKQTSSQMNSLMMSSQGKIQGALRSFGAKDTSNHDLANYTSSNPDDLHKRVGSDAYKAYMQKLSLMEPQAFVKDIKELPAAPTANQVEADPSLARYTYIRQECLKCHTGSKGSDESYRGEGCASCHIPYSKSGYYEGGDKSINKKEKGHLLVHSIQSSRDAKVKVNGVEYSGIPVQTCRACHNSSKRIGLSYQGLMQNSDDNERYIHMQGDIHFEKGMLCQDCHSSNDMHGDGFLRGSAIGAVEVECQDCHGTTKAYPWELPLGYADEFNTTAAKGEARGVTKSIPKYLKQGSIYEVGEGYLLSARGNPMIHTQKNGDMVIIHLASGKNIELRPLKKLKKDKKLSKEALVAMDRVSSHTKNMECYTCHAIWAPQHYASFVKIDYSDGKKGIDYLKSSQGMKNHLIDGEVTQSSGFIRWEEPLLVQNAEGRITPAIPLYQNTVSVIGKDGNVLLEDHIYKSQKGKSAIGVSPVQPHTVSKRSRSCESCHVSKKAMGFGIDGLSDNSYDYSRFMDENASQIQRVGGNFKLEAPLNKAQREKLDREGVCLSCHRDIFSSDLAVSAMTHTAKMLEIEINKETHDNILNKLLNLGAAVQLLIGALLGIFVMLFIYNTFFKKKVINPRNEGWK